MNELVMLKKENKLRMDSLVEEDRICIGRITIKLRGPWLRPFELEVMRKELIGMALEARQRGSTLADTLGVGEEEFCAQLLRNSRKTSLRDIAYSIGDWVWTCAWIYLFYAWFIGTFSAGFLGDCVLGFGDLFVLIIWPLICSVMQNWLGFYAITEKGLLKHSYVVSLIGFMIFAIVAVRTNGWEIPFFTLPVWLVIGAVALYLAVFRISYRRYISRLAKEYHWQN